VSLALLFQLNLASGAPPSNHAPTDISLSNSSVSTGGGVNAFVGTLSTTDEDVSDTFTYTLVAGAGSTDNASFNISGANLRANDAGALSAGTYSVRIQTSDGLATYQEPFTITAVDPGSPGTGTHTFIRPLIRGMFRKLIRRQLP
jgi:large repetitive protein